jgi:hypothetical protein
MSIPFAGQLNQPEQRGAALARHQLHIGVGPLPFQHKGQRHADRDNRKQNRRPEPRPRQAAPHPGAFEKRAHNPLCIKSGPVAPTGRNAGSRPAAA